MLSSRPLGDLFKQTANVYPAESNSNLTLLLFLFLLLSLAMSIFVVHICLFENTVSLTVLFMLCKCCAGFILFVVLSLHLFLVCFFFFFSIFLSVFLFSSLFLRGTVRGSCSVGRVVLSCMLDQPGSTITC